MKMKQAECSETSAYKIQRSGNYPEENIQHTEHGESLKSRITNGCRYIKADNSNEHYTKKQPVFWAHVIRNLPKVCRNEKISGRKFIQKNDINKAYFALKKEHIHIFRKSYGFGTM